MKWITLPALRKQTRDNLGLIVSVVGLFVSVVAALFAGWAGYETKRTVHVQIAAMGKADDAAQKAIQLQREATELDQRPYVNAIPTDSIISWGGWTTPRPHRSNIPIFTGKLKLVASGRTPAFGVHPAVQCSQMDEDDTVGNYDKTIGLLSKKLRLTPFAYLTTNGELVKDACDISIPVSDPPLVVMVGTLYYSDVFNHRHDASFCYLGRFLNRMKLDEQHKWMLGNYFSVPYDMRDFNFMPCASYQTAVD